MVSFRLSEEEYENLVHLCQTLGVRSLSDLARDAVHRILKDCEPARIDVEAELRLLSEKMESLDQQVRRLTGRPERVAR